MVYKLIFLGTAGHDAVLPQLRASGGIILQTEQHQIHIDPGPGALFQSKQCKVNPAHTSIILVSHNHLGHSHDVNVMIDAMTFKGSDKHGIIIGDEETIHGSNRERPAISKIATASVDQVISLQPGKQLSLGRIQIQALKTIHSTPTAIGFKIMTNTCTLSYTGDTECNEEIITQYNGSDVLVVNNVYPFTVSGKNNLGSQDTITIVNQVEPTVTILTHFGKQLIKSDPLYEARMMHQRTGRQIIAAKDGMYMEPMQYTRALRQKTLQTYDLQ